MSTPLLSIRGVNKAFGAYHALRDINLEVQQGEFVAMLGPSGCGKTTLLRSVAGFIPPDEGQILIGGDDVTRRPPNARPLNTVFQNYALFPHLRVLENVAYGPRRHGVAKAEATGRAREALELVGLGHLHARYPRELSGGQQQRVALARALVNRPKLLLLDEPLSALDAKMRKHMQIELKGLQQRLGISFIFVTHDQEEAMTIADRIVVMNAGNIEQIGSGDEIYHTPKTRFVAQFIGEAAFIPCEVGADGIAMPKVGSIALGPAPHEQCLAVVRPEHFVLLQAPEPGLSTARGTVEEVISLGYCTVVLVGCANLQIAVRCNHDFPRPGKGQQVILGYRPEHARLIAE